MTQQFAPPRRYIFDLNDHREFLKSAACEELLNFIAALNGAVKDKPLSAQCEESPVRVRHRCAFCAQGAQRDGGERR
jgi:hypothetical protein